LVLCFPYAAFCFAKRRALGVGSMQFQTGHPVYRTDLPRSRFACCSASPLRATVLSTSPPQQALRARTAHRFFHKCSPERSGEGGIDAEVSAKLQAPVGEGGTQVQCTGGWGCPPAGFCLLLGRAKSRPHRNAEHSFCFITKVPRPGGETPKAEC